MPGCCLCTRRSRATNRPPSTPRGHRMERPWCACRCSTRRTPPRGDAAGTPHGNDGWDPATAEVFADPVLAEAELHVPDLTGLVLERHLTTPADLAKANPNAGPGD